MLEKSYKYAILSLFQDGDSGNMANEFFSDWDFFLSLLPEGWQEKMTELKLLKFGRKFTGKEKEAKLLRVLFIHLGEGLSLRTTAEQARLGGVADISDVGILARLRKSEAWFSWCIQKLLVQHMPDRQNIAPVTTLRLIAVDATSIKEPGATGSLWRLHYAMDLLSLSPVQILLTDIKTGEGLCHFKVSPGDLFFGDRAYAKISGIAHVIDQGGEVLCRFSPHALPVKNSDGQTPFSLLSKLRKLNYGEMGDWEVCLGEGERLIRGRVCALKKTPGAAAKAKTEILRESSKKQRKTSDRTLEFAEYILIFTTLPCEQYSCAFILQTYRLRWQIELLFKRLKSILGVGHLPKYDPECARSYLCGKILIALLFEIILHSADDFFPYGNVPTSPPQHLA